MALGSATFPSQPGREIHPALVCAVSNSSLNTAAGAEKNTLYKATNQQTKTPNLNDLMIAGNAVQ